MSRKRVILMYITEISGHHSATLAIEKALRILMPDIDILNINAFNYTNPITEKIINRLYLTVIKRAPQIWSYMYDNPNVVKRIAKIKDAVHKFNSPKLKSLFESFKPDAVLCSQAFPCGMVADFKKELKLDLPLVAVLTDYIPHAYWIYEEVDYYITPSQDISKRLIEKGVESRKIKDLGIPFDLKFNKPVSSEEVLKKFKLDSGIFTVLIMGGGQGLGPIKTIVESLEKVNSDLQEIIVTGSNKKLRKSLKKKTENLKKKILVLGYADNVHELMSVSNVIITKPGGITTAEAMVKKIPMIIVRPIPGQEVRNTAYLISKKAAVKLEKAEDIGLIIEDLAKNPQKLGDLSGAASKISKPEASFDIARLLLDLCEGKLPHN